MPNLAARNAIIRWVDYRLPIFRFIDRELNDYPTPRNLNYWWNFGSLAGFMLLVMIVTGVVLAMQYTPQATLAFDLVERIMRDVNYGWLIRYIHLNGASFFFVVTYVHIFRGFYYGSYKTPCELLWMLGVVILLLMMATAFFGYVLPWSQMAFWGAAVITNLFSAIPLIGPGIATFLWGGFAVGNPTLTRFYALHFLLPFVIVGVVILHLVALHQHGSNNPLGIDRKEPQIRSYSTRITRSKTCVLDWVGAHRPEGIYILIGLGRVATFYYFFHFLMQSGLKASEREGKPISGKFEIEDGKLQLSVYTMKEDGFIEVVADPKTGAIAKAEKVTDSDDLKAATEQKAAMAKSTVSLLDAADAATRANAGVRAVSIYPQLQDGHPVAEVTLLQGTVVKSVTEKLD